MTNIKFNSKETYLAYRSNWKAEYKLLSEEIREWKLDIRNTHCPSSYQYSGLREYKDKATLMLMELKESKQEAQRQYIQARLNFEDAQKEQYVES